jgi:RHS repeat-associated protein
MKRIIYIFSLCIISIQANTQTTTENFIRSRTFTKDDASTYLDQIQYFDGLGRPIETIQKGVTPTGADLVSFTEYDGIGREYKHWLPITSINAGAFVTQATFLANTSGLYGNDANPFSLNEYESSPLNRVTGQLGAGAAWQNTTAPKKIRTTYLTNDASIAHFFVNSSGLLQRDGNYVANTLFKTVITDEDNKIVTEYKNKLGQVVMKQSDSNVQTYYVYNDLEQLSYVIPPIAADNMAAISTYTDADPNLKAYCYIYKYDERGNCIYKRLPGCTPIYMLYDKADRLVLSQDGNQRKRLQGQSAQWTVSKYDVLGRITFTGLMYRSETDSLLNYKSIRDVISSQLITDSHADFASATPLTINYYDNYTYSSNLSSAVQSNLNYMVNSGYDKAFPVTATTKEGLNSIGLLTGTRIYQLDGSGNYTVSALYYDDKGRVVQSRSSNFMGGYDVVYNAYNFTGNPTTTYKTHNISGQSAVSERYTYSYDNAQRPLITTYSLNNGTAVVLTDMSATGSYDELGRLRNKKRHGTADAESFEYNIRNWSTKITSGIAADKFIEELFYNGFSTTKATPCYNGNIAYSSWTYGLSKRAYTYSYDALNRLTQADGYVLAGTSFFNLGYNETFGFDKMGNIRSLQRKSGGTLVDNLGTYNDNLISYSGNQMMAVTDYAGSQNLYTTKEYNNRNLITNDFAYDTNGNMTMDLDRNIVCIQYNVLNLPDLIQFGNGNQIKNKYDASGRKLSADYYTLATGIVVPINTTYNLENRWDLISTLTGTVNIDNFEYSTSNDQGDYQIDLEKVYNAEGYVQNILAPVYYYFRKDHLGNNREVWCANTNTTVQRTEYYASGLPWNEGIGASVQRKKYNGKEFVEMHGYDTYDYGDRGYYPAIMRWCSIDKKAELYYSVSPYVYSLNDPVNAIDPDGRLVIFINGFTPWKSEQGKPAYWQRNREVSIYGVSGKIGKKTYTESFDNLTISHFNENAKKSIYLDGSLGGLTGIFNNESLDYASRYANGYVQGENSIAGIIKGLARSGGVITESIKVITHSMGAAYGKGFVQAIVDYAKRHPKECVGLSISEYDFAAFEQNKQNAVMGVSTFQYDNNGDVVVGGYLGFILGSRHAKENGAESSDSKPEGGHSVWYYINLISNLPQGTYIFDGEKFVQTH